MIESVTRKMKLGPRGEFEPVTRLVGVYDADGSLRGELSYWVGARTGRRHCALCEITHGIVRERKDWRECRDAMEIPFDTVHRDEATPDVIEATVGKLPAIVAITTDGAVAILGPQELEDCMGSPTALIEAIRVSANRMNLDF